VFALVIMVLIDKLSFGSDGSDPSGENRE